MDHRLVVQCYRKLVYLIGYQNATMVPIPVALGNLVQWSNIRYQNEEPAKTSGNADALDELVV